MISFVIRVGYEGGNYRRKKVTSPANAGGVFFSEMSPLIKIKIQLLKYCVQTRCQTIGKWVLRKHSFYQF